jgi:hypothetical protein
MDSLWVVLPSGQRASGEWIDDTLRRRAEEQGLLARTPLAGRFPRQRVEVIRHLDPVARVNALFYGRGWTDGLPIVPPSLARVEAMLRFTDRPGSDVLGAVEPLRGLATVEKIAVNAVMAGCRPEYFPVVLAAVEAILDPAFNLRGVQTTDENVAPLVIVSGPLASRLQINSGYGALGPGWRANATIGRALRLVMNNLGGGWPGAVSLAGLAQPGRYTLCLAERAEASPWLPLHVELGHRAEESTVTVLRAETAINVTGGLAELASVMGSAASGFTLLHSGRVAVVVAPFVAAGLAREGWSKDTVKRWLHREGRVPVPVWRASWLHAAIQAEAWPAWVREAEPSGSIPATRDPDDITVVVAGADLAIPQNAYFPSWGHPSCRITRPIALPHGWEARLGACAEA